MTAPTQTYPFTDEGVTSALVALGLDPEDVADDLLEAGYFGVPGSDCKCPIAHYLMDVVEGAVDVGVFLDDALGREDNAHARLENAAGDVLHVDLTAAVIVFIRRFDASKYPDLIEKEPVNA